MFFEIGLEFIHALNRQSPNIHLRNARTCSIPNNKPRIADRVAIGRNKIWSRGCAEIFRLISVEIVCRAADKKNILRLRGEPESICRLQEFPDWFRGQKSIIEFVINVENIN